MCLETGGPSGQLRASAAVDRAMRICTDVHYREHEAVGAAVLFADWTAPVAADTRVVRTATPAAYVPGRFYERELPTLLALVKAVGGPIETIVIDGYVWLGAAGERGLGAHLHEALGGQVPIVGVAKTAYQGSSFAEPVVRGLGRRPLFVTAAGISPSEAVGLVKSMHGPHRVPTLLGAVDRLCRTA